MTQLFMEAIKNKEINKLRSYIISSIKDDPRFEGTEASKCLKVVQESNIDIFEAFAPTPCETEIPDDESKWDKILFFDKLEDLRLNFAYNERIPMIKKIGQAVFEPMQSTSFVEAPASHGSANKRKWLPFALITGGVVVLAILLLLLLK